MGAEGGTLLARNFIHSKTPSPGAYSQPSYAIAFLDEQFFVLKS
ncbi:hypothetical protein ACS15_2727 [Ralstonia insidiosa]|uniref:Uncharacterized protein n=1 Tax=Ralstonia insidiosa TaxID=190721 RepID=A0AAC9BIK8_9RALS|nr:hypothetical protein ACS15_2727 [Ralstonia insidiosa]EPX96713.1 hypothetical protein C404_17030 [Ralstonia sp. AU12-08]